MNRLIEYVNERVIVEVCKDFLELVNYGLDPDYAFEVVISDYRHLHG